jgi:hypothetical protein
MPRMVDFFLFLMSTCVFSFLGVVLIPLALPNYPDYSERLLSIRLFRRSKVMMALGVVLFLALFVLQSVVVSLLVVAVFGTGTLQAVVIGMLVGVGIALTGIWRNVPGRVLLPGVNLLVYLQGTPENGRLQSALWMTLVGLLAILSLLCNLIILAAIFLIATALARLLPDVEVIGTAISLIISMSGLEYFFLPSYFVLVRAVQEQISGRRQVEILPYLSA